MTFSNRIIVIFSIFVSLNGQAQSCREFYSGLAMYSKELVHIPTGEKQATKLDEWLQDLEIGKKNLDIAQAQSLRKWIIPADEGVFGTKIENPTSLVGEVIAGINRNMTNTGGSTITFAGKVIDVKNVSGPNDMPFYHATLETLQGIKEVKITGVKYLSILKKEVNTPSSMGISAVDALPIGQTKFYTAESWVDGFQKAKKDLLKAVNSDKWIRAGKETLFGTDIADVESLNGKIITGVNRSDAAVEILAGKVIKIFVDSSDPTRPFFSAELEGPMGKTKIDLTGLFEIHILK